MKNFIFLFIATLSTVAIASEDAWVVMTARQAALTKKDPCALAAVEAGAGLISSEIQDAGVDYPDHLYLLDLQVTEPGKQYAVTFRDDVTMMVDTKMVGKKCRAGRPSRFEIEPRLSGGN